MTNQYADLVFVNGPVITVDDNDSVAEAAATAGNKIIHVGDRAGAEALVGPETETVDLAGRCLIPGFNDAHCHLGSVAANKLRVPCSPVHIKSIEEMKAALAERAKTTPKDEWIVGWGYDHTEMAEGRHPTRWDLDEAAPDHKVCVFRTCGHVVATNSRGLADCGYDRNTPDPEGGKLVRDDNGRLTGVLIEQPRAALWMRTIPTAETLKRAMPLLNQEFIAYGITSAQDCSGRHAHENKVILEAARSGELNFRVGVCGRWAGPAVELGKRFIEDGLVAGLGDQYARISFIKMMQDGSLGGSSAAVRAPYPDQNGNTGILYFEQTELDAMVKFAHDAGWQIGIHAIGDRAVEMVLEAIEKADAANHRPDARHRIEHYGLLDEEMMDKTVALGVVPILGVPFIYQLGDNYIHNLGLERTAMMYPLKSLIKRGVIAPLSTDGPVITPNPMNGLYSAVTRTTKTGQKVSPDEAVTIMEALRAYTAWGAYATFEEDLKGTIEAGKLADLAVLDANLLEATPEEILQIKCDLTVFDGRVVYRRK